MTKTVVFLHGVGDGDPHKNWLAGLNRGFPAAGSPQIDSSQVISPDSSLILGMAGGKAKHPQVTYNVKDDRADRRAFVRRQARIERLLEQSELATGFGLRRVPDAVVTPLQKIGIQAGSLPQVRNYMTDERLRAVVLSTILKALPDSGDIVLIGHSLGSIIAIDLLDHLPEDLHVSRFITIGSPGAARILHEKHERILKRFPYARVDDWSNFFVPHDPVTAGRGIASIFPGAQDFRIQVPVTKSNQLAHNAAQYLEHPAVGMLVADALSPTEDVLATGTEVAIRLDETSFDALFTLAYATRVSTEISKKEVATRYADTLKVLGDEFVDGVRQRLPEGSALPVEVEALSHGQRPRVPRRLELDDAVRLVVTMAFANVIQPYEISVGDAQVEAIPEFFAEMGFSTGVGRAVRKAIVDVQKVLSESGGFPTGRLALAAAGLALIAAGPIGIATMGTAAGAAAITSGLAAFGPGGMAGGLALLSGLASTGAMVTTAAATLKTGESSGGSDPASLAIRVASSHALMRVGEQPDASLWSSLTVAESVVAGHINKLAEYSDPKAPQLTQLMQTRDIINRLMTFAHDNGLGRTALA
ncbi:GPI inositol-deacylase [Dietzia aurantiaca]|uniref:alpha/beta fold hydrolase n=1 Tax=Dietzia aurantiaca TaxID=983873 RepID=UPI001E54D1EE|nr:alpha/beta fold hydrolase [Dietzia aurantiaca]MCD2262878.1 GPI inositol-deacylase [Dietzia aurantiaca]